MLLGVKPATVYTYVSRGNLASRRKPGDRASWFRRSDVEELVRTRSRRPSAAPIDDGTTSVSFISGSGYWYRGEDPVRLTEDRTFEQVADFLWQGRFPSELGWSGIDYLDAERLGITAAMAQLRRPLDVLRLGSAALAVADHLRYGLEPASVAVSGRQIIGTLVRLLPVRSAPVSEGVAAQLWARLCDTAPSVEQLHALNGALILLADHAVAPSTKVVRIAAAYRADPHGAVEAGMAVVAGAWHGGRAISAETMLSDVVASGDAAQVLGEEFRKGRVPALGQPRYRGGDPRYTHVLEMVERAGGDPDVLEAMRALHDLTVERALPQPSVEFALAAMARAFGMIRGASEAIFAVGRMAGWIAHAIEEYERDVPAPPRSRYVGPHPGS